MTVTSSAPVYVIKKGEWIKYKVKKLDVSRIPRPILRTLETYVDDINDEWYKETQQLTIQDISFAFHREAGDKVVLPEKPGHLWLVMRVLKKSPNYREGMKFHVKRSVPVFPKGTWREFFDGIKL